MSTLDRRTFVRTGSLAAAAVAGGPLRSLAAASPSVAGRGGATVPFVVTSHSNETGRRAMEEAWAILADGGSALDAVERAANVIEVDPEDMSVGYGGLPNQDGVVQLDASIMDGRTYNAGSVASLENIMTPSSVARLVMERTDHVMLVGPGALAFARSFGFEEQDLMTEESRAAWLRWRESHSDSDDWGPPEHLVGREGMGGGAPRGSSPMEFTYGTTNVLAVDRRGDVAGITTTSGLSWKIPGRIGDSPIIGAGLYVDNEVGAAGATGRGEDVIKACASFDIVARMAAGRTPQQACEEALEKILARYRAIGIDDFVPSEKFVAISRTGEVGVAWMGVEGVDFPELTVGDETGVRLVQGTRVS